MEVDVIKNIANFHEVLLRQGRVTFVHLQATITRKLTHKCEGGTLKCEGVGERKLTHVRIVLDDVRIENSSHVFLLLLTLVSSLHLATNSTSSRRTLTATGSDVTS